MADAPSAEEVRLRIVEALVRQSTGGDYADPKRITEKASILENYVLASELKAEKPRGRGRPRRA